ncbi:unnamed protein product, partial [Discosporangium mesarthrocarpum]
MLCPWADFFAILPIIFLGVGSTAPGLITAAINGLKNQADSDFERRRIYHEAAHFLAGYLCGLPIKSYKVEGSTTCVEFYDSREGDMETTGRMFSKREINQVSVVAMAGAVGEV